MANKFSKWNWLFNMKYSKSQTFFESFSEADGTPFQKWIASFQQSSRVVRRHQLTINKLTWTAPNTKKAPVLSVEKELSLWQNLIKSAQKIPDTNISHNLFSELKKTEFYSFCEMTLKFVF